MRPVAGSYQRHHRYHPWAVRVVAKTQRHTSAGAPTFTTDNLWRLCLGHCPWGEISSLNPVENIRREQADGVLDWKTSHAYCVSLSGPARPWQLTPDEARCDPRPRRLGHRMEVLIYFVFGYLLYLLILPDILPDRDL